MVGELKGVRSVDPYDHLTVKTSHRLNIEEINDADVDFKKDFPVGEGALYTG
jgi:hypothetical protein